MKDELLKLAALLRQQAGEYEQRKMFKCAQIIRSTVGLTLLKKKLES